jgi:methyl-accepting chemotaxis protein
VRKLAERSQSAAREIGGLATSSVNIAQRSGQLLTDLVPTIRKTADLVREVTAASTEQSAGVSQINKAMAAVDESTQRNASAAEELASTAEELAAQAESLQETISFFTISGVVPSAHASPSIVRVPVATPPVKGKAGAKGPLHGNGHAVSHVAPHLPQAADNYTSF